MAITGRNT